MESDALAELQAKVAGAQAKLGVSLEAALGAIGKQAVRAERREIGLWGGVHPVPVRQQAVTGSDTVDSVEGMGPKDGYWWDLRRLTAWNFTGGSLSAYINDVNAEPFATWSQTGQWTWSGHVLLGPRDRIIYVGSSLSGTAYVAGQAIEVGDSWLPEYLI